MYNEVLKVLCTHLYIGIKRDQISLKVPFMQSNRAEEAGVEERDIHIYKLNCCLAELASTTVALYFQNAE